MKDAGEMKDFANILKIIGHPVRLTILVGLFQKHSCVKDIWDCLGLPQATVSQHLAALKAKKILSVKKIGAKREYSVSDPFVKSVLSILLEQKIWKD